MATKDLADLREAGKFDTILLQGAASGKSFNEISRSVNGVLDPAQCGLRVRALLDDKNVWTVPERKHLVLEKLYGLAGELETLFKTSGDTQDGKALLSTLTQIGDRLDKQSAVTDEELARVNAAQARELLKLVVSAFDYAKERLAEEHPDIPMEVVETYFREGLETVTYDAEH